MVAGERGISVSAAVMSFEHEGFPVNLLDTPGQRDFSPVGFQRGHLPHPDRGPTHHPPPQAAQAGEGAGLPGHDTPQQ